MVGRSVLVKKLIAGAIVGVTIGLAAAVVAYQRPLLFERGEFWTYDVRARAAASAHTASPDIVIVDVSEQAIEDAENHLGVTWPWPRELYAYIAQYATMAGARAVVFDWLFMDRGQYSVDDAEAFADAMRESGKAVIGLALTQYETTERATEGPWAARLAEYPTRAEAERVAIELMAWNTRSYLVGDGPTTLYYGGKAEAEELELAFGRMAGQPELEELFTEAPVPVELTAEQLAAEYTAEQIIAERDGLPVAETGRANVPVRAGMHPPLAVIAAGPSRTGNVYQGIEADGVMRRYTPLVRYRDRYYPSLALAAYLVAHPDVEVKVGGGALSLGDRRIPLDEDGKVPIRFHGTGVYEHVSAYAVMQSLAVAEDDEATEDASVPLEVLRDKYIIVSASAAALRDIRVTPVSGHQLGAEIQANALDNLESGVAIRRVSRAADAAIALFLCIGVALLMVIIWSSIPRASIALVATGATTVVGLVGFWYLARWLYVSSGVWIAVATPGVAAAITTFTALLVTSAAERRSRRFVQEALGRYTSPALVNELTEHPEHLSLEWGDQRQMSVYFSDIAGFTTISEGLEPKRLVALLNDYLTNMTDIVLAHDGVVDKYIGDAVMAFWGAPIRDEDHAIKAVKCAIAMRDRCDALRDDWQREFGTTIHARAGVNSGEAVVGNMGSKHKYNYTVMGDMVNLAARLEGANKPYGTYLMISEYTLAAVGEAVEVRELDLLVVKGKEVPVRVFEVLGEAGTVDPDVAAAVEVFEQGLELYRKREFSAALAKFEQVVQQRPDDGPSRTYIDRCKQLIDDPPDADWDGVWRLKEK